jgi:hypothetical protein
MRGSGSCNCSDDPVVVAVVERSTCMMVLCWYHYFLTKTNTSTRPCVPPTKREGWVLMICKDLINMIWYHHTMGSTMHPTLRRRESASKILPRFPPETGGQCAVKNIYYRSIFTCVYYTRTVNYTQR